MALPFPKLVQALLIKSQVEARWWLGMHRVRTDLSRMGVLKRQPALCENLVLLMPSMPTHLFPSMAASEQRCNKGHRACRGENIYCMALHRKQFASSSLGEIRAGSVLQASFSQGGAWLLGLKVAKIHGVWRAVASLSCRFVLPQPLFPAFFGHSLRFRFPSWSRYLYKFPRAAAIKIQLGGLKQPKSIFSQFRGPEV